MTKRKTSIGLACILIAQVLALQPTGAEESTSTIGEVAIPQPEASTRTRWGNESNHSVGATGNLPSLQARPKLALTLAGGGARGAAHIGVLRVFERAGIRPDFVSGSSMGAVIGGLYSAGVPLCEIERLFLDGEIRRTFLPHSLQWQLIKATAAHMGLAMLGIKPVPSLYSGRRVEKFIDLHLPASCQYIEQFPIPFSVISTDLLDTRSVWVSKGKASHYIRASAATPLLYPPVDSDGKCLVDGGVRENLPTAVAEATGAPLIVAVKLHSNLETQPKQTYRDLFAYADRLLSIYMAEVEAKATSKADVVVAPDLGNLNLYSFERSDMVRAIMAGERAAEEQLPKIRAALGRQFSTASSTPVQHE